MIYPADYQGWTEIGGGAWEFSGKRFADHRGESYETCDLVNPPGLDLADFQFVQENILRIYQSGCARGLHYQAGSLAQAKLVTLLTGSAQVIWLPLGQSAEHATVHSSILRRPGDSVFTGPDCAHGVISLENDTRLLMKMSKRVALEERREINLLSPGLTLNAAIPLRPELMSDRDRNAPVWTPRGDDRSIVEEVSRS